MTDDDLLAGRYRTLRLIGTGGMARVFLAEDQRLGREVAVKRLHAHSPEDIARRFQREARLGAALNHPNLVAVYDVETDGESVLIVMEYVDGTDLARELKAGRLDPERAVAMIADVAAALDAVHEKGIVHRDVKPANVLLRADGTAKLGDLGIATLTEGTSITASGAVLGTASYMAPEQVRGEAAGPQADIYALAAVAYEALSGERAHPGDTAVQIAHSITDGPVPDVREPLARGIGGGGHGAEAGDGAGARGPAAACGRPGRRAGGRCGWCGRAANRRSEPTAATRAAPAPGPPVRLRTRPGPHDPPVAPAAAGADRVRGGRARGARAVLSCSPAAGATTAAAARPPPRPPPHGPSGPRPRRRRHAPRRPTPQQADDPGRDRAAASSDDGLLAAQRPRLRPAPERRRRRRGARAPTVRGRLPAGLDRAHPRLRPVQPGPGAAPDRARGRSRAAAGEAAVVLGQPARHGREGACAQGSGARRGTGRSRRKEKD